MGTQSFSTRELAKKTDPLRRYRLAAQPYISTKEICELCRCGYKKALELKTHLLSIHLINDSKATLNNGQFIRTRYVLDFIGLDKNELLHDAESYARIQAIKYDPHLTTNN
jgi:hypothetical protein